MTKPEPLLRVPPFPGARAERLMTRDPSVPPASDAEVDRCIVALRAARVGGAFWGAWYGKRFAGCIVDCRRAATPMPGMVAWPDVSAPPSTVGWTGSSREPDPWALLGDANLCVMDAPDVRAGIALLAGTPVRVHGVTGPCELQPDDAAALRGLVRAHLTDGWRHTCPYTGNPSSAERSIELCAFWRKLIDDNRDLSAALGFALWKRRTAAPLLWNGSSAPFTRTLPAAGTVALWRSRTSERLLRALDATGLAVAEVEDGFIRSVGLGADCVPPLSLLVDRTGAHFDPSRPSDLETLLSSATFDEPLLERARHLRQRIVAAGISKYGRAGDRLSRPGGARRHILVPGQVEDDRAVRAAGAVSSNLELLRRARAAAPDAFILYKPHPDVEAGHRTGAVPDGRALEHADQVVRGASIDALITSVDEVHVNTSLAGFEALLRGRPVTTHGVPFYAGWGLTDDLGPVPARRGRKLTLDQLTAAALLLYPRYLDPLSGLPCDAAILVERLASGLAPPSNATIRARRALGWLRSLTHRYARIPMLWVRSPHKPLLLRAFAPVGWACARGGCDGEVVLAVRCGVGGA